MKKFLSKRKGPLELVASIERNIKVLVGQRDDQKTVSSKSPHRASQKISNNLSQMKLMLYGDGDNESKPELAKKLVDELFRTDLLRPILDYIQKFEFEARKDVANIYNYVLRQRKEEAIAYIHAHPSILKKLVEGYAEPDIALNCGNILREVIRHEELNLMLLNDKELFKRFFEYVQLSTFDVASDAFATFKLMLTRHTVSCSKFLDTHYTEVFDQYNVLLQSTNYVTKRQSLKLLGELLLKRANYSVMMKYINSADNLKIMMNLLRGNTKAVQFEAFHVFKIFVANPKKSRPVLEILVRNKAQLVGFLQKFQSTKDDEQLTEEKAILLAALEKLDISMLESAATTSTTSTTILTTTTTSTTISTTTATSLASSSTDTDSTPITTFPSDTPSEKLFDSLSLAPSADPT